MRLIAALERRLERLFERPAARLFATPLQAVQLQRRLERALEVERVVGDGRIYAPDEYSVHLNPADLEVLRSGEPQLERRLAEALVARTRKRGYFLGHPPIVRIVGDADTPRGEAHVGAAISAGLEAGRDGPLTIDATAVYRAPAVAHPLIDLVVREPDADARRVRAAGAIVRIGRSPDNEIVIADAKVSRHHGELRMRHGTLVYRDLRSTNGSCVNGTRIRETAVGVGDRLEVGDTIIVVEPA